MANVTRHSISGERVLRQSEYFKLSLEELEDIARRSRRRAMALKLIWMADELAKLSDVGKINIWLNEMDKLTERLNRAGQSNLSTLIKQEMQPGREVKPALEVSSALKNFSAYQWSPQSLAKWALTGLAGQQSDVNSKKQPDELSICTDKNTRIDVVTSEMIGNSCRKTAGGPMGVKTSPFITNLGPYTPFGVGSVVDAMSENVVTAVERSTSLITLPLSIVGLGKMPRKNTI